MSTAPTFTNLVAAFSPPYCGAALSAVSVVIARCTPSAVAAFLCQSHSSLDDAIVSLISCVASVATDSAFTYLLPATGDRYIFDSVAPMVPYCGSLGAPCGAPCAASSAGRSKHAATLY